MALFSDIGDFFKRVGGFFGGIFQGPEFPEIPPPRRPPPPTAKRPAPPRRIDPDIQEAGAEVRGMFRRRGRRTTVLTPGRGEGLTPSASTRERLGETRR